MDWFLCLCSILLLYLSTQRALYNMLHSPVHTSTFSLLFFLFFLSNIHKHSFSEESMDEQLGVRYLTQGHWDTQTEEARDWSTNLVVNSSTALPPEPLHVAYCVSSVVSSQMLQLMHRTYDNKILLLQINWSGTLTKLLVNAKLSFNLFSKTTRGKRT